MIEQYSREEFVGYLIITLANQGKEKDEIKSIVCELEKNINEFTEVHAEQIHDRFYKI